MSPKIDTKEIVKLIDLLDERGLSEFELEIEGFKIKMSKNSGSVSPVSQSLQEAPSSPPGPEPGPDVETENSDRHHIYSPMVGTFYRSANPSSPPYVEIGDQVEKNQTLCIIEAMKLMNEIESDIEGVIEEICIENGKPIEYGQKLFAIKPL